jgi:hypothetical protein
MFSLLSSLKSYFTGETPPVEPEAETPGEKEEAVTTEPTFKTEVEVKVPEKPKIPIYAFGQKAPYYVKDFEVSRVDLEAGETMRASLLHSWMYQEGFIDKMTKAHVEVPVIKRIPDPVYVYISADTGAVQATIVTEGQDGDNYWEEGENKYDTIIEQINTTEEEPIQKAIYRVWRRIIAEHDFRNSIQSILLYGYELYNLAELQGCPVVYPDSCFDYIWNYDDDTLFYWRNDYERMGFSQEVSYDETPEETITRSSMPSFSLVADFRDYDSPLIQKILPIDAYDVAPIDYDNISETIIYIDDYSVSLVDFKTCTALETYPITEDIEEIIKKWNSVDS